MVFIFVYYVVRNGRIFSNFPRLVAAPGKSEDSVSREWHLPVVTEIGGKVRSSRRQ
jgi:hypothetical protein